MKGGKRINGDRKVRGREMGVGNLKPAYSKGYKLPHLQGPGTKYK
jgi:hypothetical protein